MCLELPVVNAALGRELDLKQLVSQAVDGPYRSAEYIDRTGLDFKLTPQRRGWIVTRALYRAPDGLLRQAHSSPVYISVDGKPAASAADARYMLRWIDHLAESAKSDPKRFPDADARNSVLGIYAEASARYEKIIEDARKHWAD